MVQMAGRRIDWPVPGASFPAPQRVLFAEITDRVAFGADRQLWPSQAGRALCGPVRRPRPPRGSRRRPPLGPCP